MSLHCWKYSLWFGWGNYLDWVCRRQDTWHPLTSKAADHEQNNDHLLISLKDMQLFHVKNTCFYCMFPWTLKYNSNEKKKKKGGRRGGHRFVLKGSWLVGVFHRKSPIARANADPCQPVSTVGADEGEHSLRQQWAWVPWGKRVTTSWSQAKYRVLPKVDWVRDAERSGNKDSCRQTTALPRVQLQKLYYLDLVDKCFIGYNFHVHEYASVCLGSRDVNFVRWQVQWFLQMSARLPIFYDSS